MEEQLTDVVFCWFYDSFMVFALRQHQYIRRQAKWINCSFRGSPSRAKALHKFKIHIKTNNKRCQWSWSDDVVKKKNKKFMWAALLLNVYNAMMHDVCVCCTPKKLKANKLFCVTIGFVVFSLPFSLRKQFRLDSYSSARYACWLPLNALQKFKE